MSADERLELAPRLLELLETASPTPAQAALLASLIEGSEELRPTLAAVAEARGWSVLPEARRMLDRSVAEARRSNRQHLDVLAEVAAAFERAGLPWTLLKGMDHLVRFREPLGRRAMEDVDLLVAESDFDSAIERLDELGFEAMAPQASSRVPGHAFRRGSVMIDLHRSLTVAGMPPVLDTAAWDRRERVEHEGLTVPLLPVEAALLASALLAVREGFRPPGFRLRKGLDLLRLVEAAGSEGVERARVMAARAGVRRPLARALEWSAWLRGGAKPPWLVYEVEARGSSLSRRRRELLWHASLFDSAWRRLQVVVAEVSTGVARAATARRLGRAPLPAEKELRAPSGASEPGRGEAFRRAPDTLHRRVDDREVVLEPRRGRYFALDGIGVEVWSLLDRPRTLESLVAVLAPSYDVARERLRSDLRAYLGTLEREGLLERCEP
jgi:hypothetical protein